MRTKRTDDGWLIFLDGKREVCRVRLPDGGFTRAELEAFKRHLIARLHGGN